MISLLFSSVQRHLGDELDTSGVFVVLEKAHLKYAKVGRQLTLLNAQDHADYLMRNNEDPALYRPDIVHQALMTVLDSPLNKAGKIRGVYIHTTDNHVIYIDPIARIPRMFKRFCGLIVEVLQVSSVFFNLLTLIHNFDFTVYLHCQWMAVVYLHVSPPAFLPSLLRPINAPSY